MSVLTLQDIWNASSASLKEILEGYGYELSTPEGSNYDRAIAAMIYFNEGRLTGANSQWVAMPNFLEVMSASSSLEEGLFLEEQSLKGMRLLREPFQQNLLHFYKALTVASDAAEHAIGDVVDDITDGDTVRIAARDAARMAARLPGATAQSIVRTAWKVVIEMDNQIRPAEIKQIEFDPIAIITPLLQADLKLMIPIARCFYLASLWELLGAMPPNEDLTAQLNTLIEQYGCGAIFEEIPITITTGLSPLLGALGIAGGREALSTLIGEYVSRPPTREEVMRRLLALL